ncbi:MAG: amidohydrolase family protein [Lentisphaeria bacterium]|nr:amidohydrolase family protein [Lentisphaeria bacterium]NLZ60204.1 amidohydrolase family protein [Lentisphaerota bacterium]
MFIDIHVHFRRSPGFPRWGKQAYATPEQLLERYAAIEVERAVVLPGVNPECSHVPQSNEEVLEVAQKHPLFIPFCNVDPRALTNSIRAEFHDIFSFYKDQGCKGIGEVCANLHFTDPLVQNMFKGAESAGLPLTFHIAPSVGESYGLFDNAGLLQLETCLQRFPKLKFFGHSQAFWAEMAPLKHFSDRWGYPNYSIEEEGRVPQLMRKYGNLYGDLSAGSGCNALTRDRAYSIKFLNEFQDRLFFGTDICAPDTPTPLVDYLLELRSKGEISEQVFQKVARENALRVLEL